MLNGSCLCGAVHYEINAEIHRITHCHCSMCRKGHGAAYGSYGTVRHDEFRFTKGEDAVVKYRSSPSALRTFCKHCGSTLQWYSEVDHPETVGIAVGTVDTPFAPPPQQHIYVDSKASWFDIRDDLPQRKD